MQKLHFTSCLLVILVVGFFGTCYADIELTIGKRVDGDEELESEDFFMHGLPSSAIAYVRTLTGDGSTPITQITVDRLSRENSFVALTHGGPGQTFASFEIPVRPGATLEYKVKLYGKKN